MRLEKFLDPKNLRSDLLDQFRKSRPAVDTEPPRIEAPYAFDDQTLFASHRAPLRMMRKLLMPILKLFFNPNVLNQILHTQAQFNVDLLKRESRRKIEFDRSRAEWNSLYYEVLHNLVLETTRMGIEVQNLRMKSESLSSRLDFSERRVRALEGVVQYRPEVVRSPERRDNDDSEPAAAPQNAGGGSVEGFVPGGQPRQATAARGANAGAGAAGAEPARRAGVPRVPRVPRCIGCIRCIGCARVRRVRRVNQSASGDFDDGGEDDGSEEVREASLATASTCRSTGDEQRRQLRRSCST